MPLIENLPGIWDGHSAVSSSYASAQLCVAATGVHIYVSPKYNMYYIIDPCDSSIPCRWDVVETQ